MTTYKLIISGRLEFGRKRSYDKVIQLFEHRYINYYRGDVAFKTEDVFDEENLAISIPRLIHQEVSAKRANNTAKLLEYVAQYAIAGSITLWMIADGDVKKLYQIEPDSDKVAVQEFLRGRQLVQEAGQETEAMKALNRAIEKFARHASAYERRGYVNLKLRNYQDALYDFTKSIDINPRNAESYLGRARVKMLQQKHDEAITDLDMAIKYSIPLQPIYWTARRLKADCHLELDQPEKAIFELKLFTKRQFDPSNPNYAFRKSALTKYGRLLMKTDALPDAIDAFNKAIEIEGGDQTQQGEQFLYRGIALQKAGRSGYVKDWKAAANLGSADAEKLLTEHA